VPRTRRDILQTTALAFGGSALTSLAGCLGGSTGTAETATDKQATTTSIDETSESFHEWLIDPTNTPIRDGYGVIYHDVAGIRKRRNAIHENAYERLEAEMLRHVPARELLDLGDVSATLSLDFEAEIAFGSFDPHVFEERLTEEWNTRSTPTGQPTTATRTPPPESEQYRGFRLFGDRRVYAVSESVVLLVSMMRDGDSLERAKAILDARLDAKTRYPDSNEYVDAMLGLVENTHALTCYPEAMDGSTSRGFRKDVITGGLKSWRFGSKMTQFTFANTYHDAEAAENAEFDAYLESESDRFDPYKGLDVMTDDQMVWIEGTIHTGEFDYLSPGGPSDGVHTANG
jgi:hypothetical protein